MPTVPGRVPVSKVLAVANASTTLMRLKSGSFVGGIGQHENTWRMAQVRGPEGVVVPLTEGIG
jgi:hypothetical protein